jgi:hypothetical protein
VAPLKKNMKIFWKYWKQIPFSLWCFPFSGYSLYVPFVSLFFIGWYINYRSSKTKYEMVGRLWIGRLEEYRRKFQAASVRRGKRKKKKINVMITDPLQYGHTACIDRPNCTQFTCCYWCRPALGPI